MMKKILVMSILLLSFTTYVLGQNDEDQIKEVVQKAYVDGIQNKGSLTDIDQGFHPCFQLIGVHDDGNRVNITPIYNWREGVRAFKEANPEAAISKRTCKFILIDITGQAAIAKIELYTNDKKDFTDYLSLYKFKDGWRIVNKIYNRH